MGRYCILAAGLLLCPYMRAASVRPTRVCEVLRRPAEYEGRAMMIVGRLSARGGERFLGEEKCGDGGKAALLELHADAAAGPKPDGSIDVDTAAVERSVAEMKKSTALRNFPFGSGDYDRWALVYGRVEMSGSSEKPVGDRFAGRVVLRSDSLVIFLNDQ